LKSPQLIFTFIRAPHPSAGKFLASISPEMDGTTQQAKTLAEKRLLVCG